MDLNWGTNVNQIDFFFLELIFARDGILRKSPYCIIIHASDPTIVNYGIEKSANATVCLTADLNKIHETERPTALALQSTPILTEGRNAGGGGKSKNNRKNSRKITYSVDDLAKSDQDGGGGAGGGGGNNNVIVAFPKDATVYRTATNFTRVMQAGNITELMARPNLKFRIMKDPSYAFGITELGGIVYVKNSEILQNMTEDNF